MDKVQIASNFYYDPQRQGYNTNLFKTLSGTPTIVSDKLRISNAEAIHYADILHGFFNIVANIPATPTSALLTGGTSATTVVATWNAVEDGEFAITIDGVAYDITGLDFSDASDMDGVALVIQTALISSVGSFMTCVWSTNKFIITSRRSITVTSAVSGGSGTDVSGAGATAFMDSETANGTVTAATNSNKIFGLTQLNKSLKCYFEVRGNTLIAVTSDETGTLQETDITWIDADWTGEDIKFEIDWSGMGVKFKVNGSQLAYHSTRIPRGPMSLYLYNSLADNLDFLYFESKDTGSVV